MTAPSGPARPVPGTPQDKTRIRDAATVIVARNPDRPQVLMGQRGAAAAFMPNKMVFPGGAIDPGDAAVPLADGLGPICRARLAEDAAPHIARAAPAAAIRELWEETGLVLGTPGAWPDAPPDWAGFAATGHRPCAAALRFVFRAITPPGRPRRFDARFFLADAAALQGDPDDFSQACDELSALQWVPLDRVRGFDLPFITQVVLAEVAALIGTEGPPDAVPFFRNDDEESLFLRLHGRPAQD
ncbi:DNA mismatch repair protein MutT [Meridianimarinicoccus roseus]|uniref:DNA mismatch repair protein MutT n=1 Tax=Meridianimarinicoccus roseus TaxID=2072018 RepID=A0A2V2LJ19_9RHOB|nr:NUDIX hydrolase [Meridianimarinicoccus roseus]PWR04031.1 DNA mismatch repair protein MutT [Meridianimarinicoccus roseus]